MKRKRVASAEEPSNMLKIGEPAVFTTLSPPTPFVHMLLAQMHSSHPVSFMLEHTTDAIVILDTEWHLVYANLAWERMMGLNREKVRAAGMTVWEYAPSLVGSELEVQYRKALETQRSCSFTCLHPFTSKYTIVWVYPSREGVCLLMKDVTDLKLLDDMRAHRAMEIQQLNEELERRVEQRTHDLKKAQEFNARVIKDSVDGIVGYDMKYEIFAWNPTMEKVTGISKDKALGRSLFDVFPWLDLYPGTRSVLERVLAGETLIFRGESAVPEEKRPPELARILSADYERVYIPLMGDREGEIIGTVIFNKNVSVQNQIQIELSKARDEALRLAKAKSEFLANMSHELRTPLNAIIGLTDLLKDSNLDTQQHEYFDIVQGSAVSLLSIVNQVLDYSKYEVGKMPLMEEDFALVDVVNSTGIAFRREADSKGLMFQWKLMDGLDDYIVNGDPGRLRQILVNLVNNAIKFTSKGFVEVILTKEKEEREKNMMCVNITVEDSGLGMSNSTLKALFTPFTQADASTTRVYGGTGLGLAIVKQIVDCMGGQISVESVEDIGTRFQLRLPFKIVGLQKSREPPDHVLSPTRHHPTCPLHPNYKQTMANLQMNKLSYDFFYGGSDMCKGACTPPPAEDPPKPPPVPPTLTPTPTPAPAPATPFPTSTALAPSSLAPSSSAFSHLSLSSSAPITTTTVTTTTTTTTTFPPTAVYTPTASYPPVYPPNYSYTQLQYNPLLKCRRRSKSADNYYEIGGKLNGTCCGGGPNCTCACRYNLSNFVPFSPPNTSSSSSCANCSNCNNNINNNNINNNNNNNVMIDTGGLNPFFNPNNNNNTYTTTEYKRKPSTERLYSHEEAVPGRCHVLVAEDNEVNQKVLSLLLKRLQATVEVCANGKEALDKLLADPSKFDLVLMDVQMPIMDGYTAAMEIRKYPTLVHIPIIAMTANAMPGDRERCLNSGMDDYIAKPINMKVLTPILQLWGKKTYIS